ncbi:C40 family peptidase [Streptomyces sp. L2]|uniref:C40 family peptidase n=1 Tax=Streptomyces sp. L2 TaxID=2162665 RepID=UPI001013453D|nr:C40 family peptidase [Streptomyces sp. L2]
MRPGKRGIFAVAVAMVSAVTVVAASGTAFTTPGPVPAPPPAAPTSSIVPQANLEDVRKRLDKLYHDAAVATDAYDAAEEASKTQGARIAELSGRIATAQRKLAILKDRAGAAARSQYRTGGLPPTAELLLSDDPQQFLDGAGRVLQGQRATQNLLGEMTRTEKDLRRYAAAASAQWKRLEADRVAKAAAKKAVQRQIDEAKRLESRLEKREKERLAKLEQEAALRAQTIWLGTGILKKVRGKASAQGEEAVQYATAQLGKPYVWGAEGPASFDCSGLTSQAWSAAGHPIPRTSQEQWKQLKHVDVKDMRPGDLIIYFGDASHVAMYVGDGAIIHAPRPGRTVTVAGAGSMPILGVVRPDA